MRARAKILRWLSLGLLAAACGGSTARTTHPTGDTGGSAGDDSSGGSGGDAGPGGSGGTGGGGAGGTAGPGGSGGDGGSGGSAGSGGAGGSGGTGGDDGDTPDGGPGDNVGDAGAYDVSGGDLPPAIPPPAGAVFKHPGVMVNRAQLDFMRAKVQAGAEPWKSMFAQTLARAAKTTKPTPFAQVICGPYSNPNIGCAEELNDSEAAWADALAWYVTGDESYAKQAIVIMNAWASTIKGHSDHNAPLQAAWIATIWPRAGELIRYTYAGWSAADIQKFTGMLKSAYLPAIVNGNAGANGNWELTMAEGTIDIAVFTEDKATFTKGLSLWHRRVPAYIYLKSDGAQPVKEPGSSGSIVSYWQGQSTFVDGIAQETCRDLLHTQLGMSSAINAAETAYQQGVDLYGMESARLRAGLEFHANYILGTKPPSWLCGGKLNLRTLPMWDIAFNHFKNRLGIDLPNTQKLIETMVHNVDPVYKQMAWEALTHTETGKLGF